MAKKRANGEGSIRKRKDGRWEGRYTAGHDPATGKTIYKNVLGKTQTEVKEKLKRAIEAVAAASTENLILFLVIIFLILISFRAVFQHLRKAKEASRMWRDRRVVQG